MYNCLNGTLQGTLSVGKGDTGKSIEYMWRGTELGLRVEGEEEFTFVDLEGKATNIHLQKSGEYVQWKYVDEVEWRNLIHLLEIKGDKGDTPSIQHLEDAINKLITDSTLQLNTLVETSTNQINTLVENSTNQVNSMLTSNTASVNEMISTSTNNVNSMINDNNLKVENLISTSTTNINSMITTNNKKVDTMLATNTDNVNYMINTSTTKVNTMVSDNNAKVNNLIETSTSQVNQMVDTSQSTINNHVTTSEGKVNAFISQGTNSLNSEIAKFQQDASTNLQQATNRITETVNQAKTNFSNQLATQTNTFDGVIATKTAEVDALTTKVEQQEAVRVQQHTEREAFMRGYEGRLSTVETTNVTQNERLGVVESTNTTQNSRLDKLEATTTNHGTRLDKVEYQNKVQDTYIQGLFNENGDKRLSVSGGGNDLKLEGSAEGLATVNKIVGNTAVNYCANGDRELYLNGDIDVTGTSVSTTEGVDNGLVDVVCEGDTLNNLIDVMDYVSTGTYYDNNHWIGANSSINISNKVITLTTDGTSNIILRRKLDTIRCIKVNTQYTFIFEILKTDYTSTVKSYFGNDDKFVGRNEIDFSKTGIVKVLATTKSDFSTALRDFYIYFPSVFTGEVKFKLMILEGDWTNKEIPPYFEGMKSVGQDDENGHKIELVSRNKNLPISSEYTQYNPNKYSHRASTEVKALTIATITNLSNKEIIVSLFNRTDEQYSNTIIIQSNKTVELNLENVYIKWIEFEINKGWNYSSAFNIKSHIVMNGHFNKLTIPLSEPLRGLPNGAKDRFVKKEGKWYIERNCGEIVLNGSEGWLLAGRQFDNCMNVYMSYINKGSNKIGGYFLADRLAYSRLAYGLKYDIECITSNIGQGDTLLIFQINKSRLSTQDIPGFKAWLQQNPTTLIYELATPTYEPLDVTPELQTYLEQTHISNNSVIPCNMVVKNTGFNSIIKPSTLYTVIADTSGTGTFGVNLGGTKLTTATNKLTITTPATLTENMLRPYGKGLKGSKFRVLEGDCTGLDYPYFEGLKSTFEGQLVTQEMVEQGLEKAENLGKYKCNVKVRGKNLFNGELETGSFSYDGSIKIPLQDEIRNINPVKVRAGSILTFSALSTFLVWEYNKNMECVEQIPKTVIINTPLQLRNDTEYINFRVASPDLSQNIQIEEGTVATPYEPYYERNETVYLTSPLLKGDEIVVKDDGLYHYHNMNKVVLDGSENWLYQKTQNYGCNNFQTKLDKSGFDNGSPVTQTVSNKYMYNGIEWEKELVNPRMYVWTTQLCVSFPSNSDINSLERFKQTLKDNKLIISYLLAEPYYEKIADYPITLDIIPTSTLSVESLIPCTTLKASYTGSVPSVYKLEETSTQNSEYIQDTQIAVDFLLMNAMPNVALAIQNTGLTEKGVNTMGAYFASRIMRGYLSYAEVVAKYPQFKDDIDFILKSEGREDLITI